MSEQEIKKHVQERYGNLALRAQAQQTSCCGPEIQAPQASCCGPETESLGCSGESLLDLGSGGGIDVFIAAQKVGPTGRAVGVDMTDEMIDLARKGADELGLENVEFRKGDIEDLPFEDAEFDVIISNCVINLAPDKDKVFKESYRVLKPGGRIAVSDIVTDGDLPENLKNNMDSWASCVSGAIDANLYLDKIRNAGFEDVKIVSQRGSGYIYSAEVEGIKPLVENQSCC
jgi:SAM-dependent methyltransferase